MDADLEAMESRIIEAQKALVSPRLARALVVIEENGTVHVYGDKWPALSVEIVHRKDGESGKDVWERLPEWVKPVFNKKNFIGVGVTKA